MVILHIANVSEYMFFGVNVAVPQHVAAQQQIETVGFVNTAGVVLDGIKNQIQYTEPFSFRSLPEPFNKPDLIVFHEVYQRKLLPIFNLAIQKKIPYVIIPHGCLTAESQKHKHLKKLGGNFFVYNRIIKNALALQCLSPREAEETNFSNRKIIGTNGVSDPKIKKTFSGGIMKFIYIGRLDVEIKGLDILISAAAVNRKLLRENRCKINLYGPDEDGCYERIRKMILQNSVEDIVTLNGPVIGEKKEEKLLGADCFIQCSRSEGMSMGILEALAAGLPCVLTKGTGIADDVYNAGAGWRCENSVVSTAAAIREAVENRNRLEEFSTNAVKMALENFSWNKVAADAINEYRKLLNG